QEKQLAQLAEQGKALINKYGCFGCHDIKGFENAQKIATELTEHGRKDPHLLDFGDVRFFTENPKQRATYDNFVWEKVQGARVFGYERVETRMPQFDFSDDEALALLTFLKGQTGDRPDKKFLAAQDPQRQAVARGEGLVFWNGCRNCHVVEGRGGAVRGPFKDDNQRLAPPHITRRGGGGEPPRAVGVFEGPHPPPPRPPRWQAAAPLPHAR